MEYILALILATGLVAVALIFAFVNGFHDGCNVMATMISSRALSPRYALVLGVGSEFLGALFLGRAVARTVSLGIVNPNLVSIWVIFAGLGGAISWNFITWWWGFPSSSSQALVGGLLGAAIAELRLTGGYSWEVIYWHKVGFIFLVLFISPVVGLSFGFLLTKLILFLSRGASLRINKVFRRLQIASSIFIGISHGSNDGPKTMGVIVMSLVILKLYHFEDGSFIVPVWVVLASAFGIALGISRGGWRIMKTLGVKLYRIRPVHGFGAQTASAFVIFFSSLTGFPVSTTQIVNSSVMGAGAADRPKAVRWGVIKEMFMAWGLTVPGAALLATLFYLLINSLL